GEEIVGVERLCRSGDPFRPCSGTAFAALVDRQAERIDQDLHLVTGGDVRTRGAQTKRILIEVVERGEAAWEEFAIDYPLGKPIDGAETKLLGQAAHPPPDQTAVARAQGQKAVAAPPPIGQPPANQAALAASFAHHVGIMASPRHFERDWI